VANIKQIKLEEANDSMIIADDIVHGGHQILVTAGTPLRREIVALLGKHGVTSVRIRLSERPEQQAKPQHPERETSAGPFRIAAAQNKELTSVPHLISAGTRIKMVQTMQTAFRSRGSIAAHLPYLRECIHEVIEELESHGNLLIYLSDIRQNSDYLYGHCVDVGVFAVAFGMAMGLTRDEIYILGIGGLLHDYGKTCIPNGILEKNGPLTPDEFEQVKQHTSLGYNILRIETKVDSRIALMALQHHERPDGRGYPWGINGDQIQPLASIVAVADVYDALITDRVYRPRVPAHEAIRIINAGAGTQFDPQVVAAVNRIVVPYYIGSAVKLDNGTAGAVLRINSHDPARPVVWTREGIINLLTERNLQIVAVV
jgi:HD-GYP domain-containing protein (c-di-GMP phosphodiesterase class II)